MSFKYWLPDENGQKTEYETQDNAVIIIGANGSGKSKLGAWIECQNFDGVHRVGAQRNLMKIFRLKTILKRRIGFFMEVVMEMIIVKVKDGIGGIIPPD